MFNALLCACRYVSDGIRVNNNTCMCGDVPPLGRYLQAQWAIGTGLYAACPTTCTAAASIPSRTHPDWSGGQCCVGCKLLFASAGQRYSNHMPCVAREPRSADHRLSCASLQPQTGSACEVLNHGLHPTTGCCAACSLAGLLALRAVSSGPLSAALAINGTWNASLPTPCHSIDPNCQPCPAVDACGAQVAGTAAPPSYYCSAWGVSCHNGRITAISPNITGLVFRQLPPQLNQLTWLQTIGELGCGLMSCSP